MRLDEFFPSVQTRVGGVAKPLLEDACRRALKVFFQHSGCWRKTIGASPMETGSAEYRLDLVDPEAVSAIISVRPDGKVNLKPVSIQALDACGRSWREDVAQNPHSFTQHALNRIMLYPKPEIEQTLRVEVSLLPTPQTQEIPDEIGNLWFDEIVDGIVGQLQDIPGKPYSDPAKAVDNKRRLLSAARDAKVRADRSGVREIVTARLTSFEEM